MSAVVRFQSGRSVIVVDPEAGELVTEWRSALRHPRDHRCSREVTVLHTERHGHPERREWVSYAAIESIEPAS